MYNKINYIKILKLLMKYFKNIHNKIIKINKKLKQQKY